MHRLDLSFYSHPKEFLGNGIRTHVNSKGKSPVPEVQRVEAAALHHAGQREHSTLPTELLGPS